MKLMVFAVLVVITALLHPAFTQKSVKPPPAAILRSSNELKLDGSFKYNFEGEDGTKVDVTGSQKRVGPKPDDVGTVMTGSFSYIAPDGTPLTVNWVADENGFQPTGAHLPVPPAPPGNRRN